jgi:hypothetical protein
MADRAGLRSPSLRGTGRIGGACRSGTAITVAARERLAWGRPSLMKQTHASLIAWGRPSLEPLPGSPAQESGQWGSLIGSRTRAGERAACAASLGVAGLDAA